MTKPIKEGAKRGRPTDYRPEMCETVIACGREGKSKAEIAAALDVTRETIYEWAKRHPDFSDALHRAHDLSLAWWEEKSRTGLEKGSSFNAALWKQAVSGRFPLEPYRERAEVSGPGGGAIPVHNLADKVGSLPRDKRDAIRAAVTAALGKPEDEA